MIFWKEMFFYVKNFLWKRRKMFQKSSRNFHSQSEKFSVIKLLFKKNDFPQNVDLAYNVKFWQLCWSFLSNLKSKSLKIRNDWVRSTFSISLFSIQLFFWTNKLHLCQLCCKNFTENLEKFRLKTEEDCGKNLFSKKMFFKKTLLWTIDCSSENRSQRLRVKSPSMVCSKFKTRRRFFCLKDII